jgi:hypothetical protein
MRAKEFIIEGWKDWFKGNKIDPALQRYQQLHPEPVVKPYSQEDYDTDVKKLGDPIAPLNRMVAVLNNVKNTYPTDVVDKARKIFLKRDNLPDHFWEQKWQQLNRKYKLNPAEVYDWDQDEVDLGDPDEVEYKQAVIDVYGKPKPEDYEIDDFTPIPPGNLFKDMYNLNKQRLAHGIKVEQEFYKKLQELGIQLK